MNLVWGKYNLTEGCISTQLLLRVLLEVVIRTIDAIGDNLGIKSDLQNNLRRVVGNDLIDISLQIFSQMCFCLKGFAKIVRLFIVFGSKEH